MTFPKFLVCSVLKLKVNYVAVFPQRKKETPDYMLLLEYQIVM